MFLFVLFSIILLIKSYIAWSVIFEEAFLWGPLITEIPFFLILFCLIEWFIKKRKLAMYMGLNIGITLIFFAAIMYYKYYGVIVTYHALNQINQVSSVSESVFTLIDPYYVLIFIDILVLSVIIFSSKRFKAWRNNNQIVIKRSVISIIFVASLTLCLVNILPNRASMNEFVQAKEMGILSYEAFNVFMDEKQVYIPEDEISLESVSELKRIMSSDQPFLWNAAEGKHLISMQMESFQSFLVGLKIDGQEITPNINRLAANHFYFSNFYQQVGSGNTSDAEFVVNTSFYIPPKGAASDMYAHKALPSLPKLLKENGYQSATFHTNDVTFWNRKELYAALGFDKYYDRSYFGSEDMVFFGASDEVLYEGTMKKLLEMEQMGDLFYAHVLSMSAHHPYTIPEEKYRITLPEQYEDTLVGQYLLAQNYADYALGLFIDQLKAEGLWDQSLFVLYGDHLGLPMHLLEDEDEELLYEILGHEYSSRDMLNVPYVIASAEFTYPMELERIGGQVDFLTTITNLLGISLDEHFHLGQDLLNNDYNLLPQRHYLPSGSFINDRALFISGKGFEDGTVYPFDGGLKDGIEEMDVVSEDEYNRALELLHLSDSYVNQLPER